MSKSMPKRGFWMIGWVILRVCELATMNGEHVLVMLFWHCRETPNGHDDRLLALILDLLSLQASFLPPGCAISKEQQNKLV